MITEPMVIKMTNKLGCQSEQYMVFYRITLHIVMTTDINSFDTQQKPEAKDGRHHWW